jgi:hypothetical protein
LRDVHDDGTAAGAALTTPVAGRGPCRPDREND